VQFWVRVTAAAVWAIVILALAGIAVVAVILWPK
jgi:hypothetical protein